MPVERTFTIKELRWNTNIWNSENGGPLSITIAHTGTPVLSRTGADRYPRRVSVQDRSCVATVVLGDFMQIAALAGISDMYADVFYDEGGQTRTMKLVGMRHYESRPTQNRATPSEAAMTFIHQSAGGQDSPLEE